MAIADGSRDCVDEAGDCGRFPEVDLDWLVDDPVDPTEVTVSPSDPVRPTTEWLSVDAGHAVALDEAR